MSELARLDERVTKLEAEMTEISFMRSTLKNHTQVLNAMRKDQIAQGKRLDGVETEMRRGFALLGEGQTKITELLTQHIEECEKN